MFPKTTNLSFILSPDTSLWIFGYGSLTWKPNFEFSSHRYGHIDGFARRFWQGSVTHRGTPDTPGRVATLVKSDKEECWGTAFEVRGEEQIIGALQHLRIREGVQGGYEACYVRFQPIDDSSTPMQVLVFIAVPENSLFLGWAELSTMAREIAAAGGASGPNCEYVFELAEYMRKTFPGVWDDHLFELEALVRDFVQSNCICCRDTRTIADECLNSHSCHRNQKQESIIPLEGTVGSQTTTCHKVLTY
ncbi:glutathione-specific gamma-glutamylcyclotransferase 1-like [Ptychodera flava]|uniref:glutathione-specific gamma-glutamylcyclotransferase 1-like n=1 Tax=Ptychodera flava TaxID=63121 RepID=UPI003969FFF9